jgi:hypothetical protein
MRKTILSAALGLVVVLAFPATATAGPGDLALQFRLGGFFPDGDSEFWDDAEETFTQDVSDFDDTIFGITVTRAFSNNLELGFNIDFYEGEGRSAVRDFVDQDGFTILHDARLEMVPITVDLRLIPGGRFRQRPGGRQVLKPVWYIGGGLGVNWWEYEEVGDFVDFTDNSIFFDRFYDDGVAFEVHALTGFELPLGPTWSLLFEGRYMWTDDEPGGDFEGLGELDMSGPSVYLGGSIRF